MKKIISTIFVVLFLAGCQTPGDNYPSARFYYLDASITEPQRAECMITVEHRQFSGYEQDLRYLLEQYFNGPLDQAQFCDFPVRPVLTELNWEDNVLCLTFTDSFAQLSGIDLTVTSICIAKTAAELSGAEAVRILCDSASLGESRYLQLTAEDFLTEDTGYDYDMEQ